MDNRFGAWGTQTFIAGLSADTMIAPRVFQGAMDGPDFVACVENALVPEPALGSEHL